MKNIFPLIFICQLIFCACTTDAPNEVISSENDDLTAQKDSLNTNTEKSLEIKPLHSSDTLLNDAEKFLQGLNLSENTTEIHESVVKQKLNEDLILALELFKLNVFKNRNHISDVNCGILGTVEVSQNYYSLIVAFEAPCCWFEKYLVNYTKNGKLIDFLLIEQDDYIEGFTPLTSDIKESFIIRTQKKSSDDEEQTYKKWMEDTLKITDAGSFIGEEKIKSNRNRKPFSENLDLSGTWVKFDKNNLVGYNTINIAKKDNGYLLNFDGENEQFHKVDSTYTIKGKNFSSFAFWLSLSSENPLILNYTDDGRNHFAPIINEMYQKQK